MTKRKALWRGHHSCSAGEKIEYSPNRNVPSRSLSHMLIDLVIYFLTYLLLYSPFF